MKGQGELLIALGIYFVVILVLFSFIFSSSVVDTRNVIENNLLFTGNKVETYVRSFLQSLRLSVLQATYDMGNAYAGKTWQCYQNNCLSGACSINTLTSGIIGGNPSLGLKGATGYANEYLKAYRDSFLLTEPKLIFPAKLETPFILADSGYIYSNWSDTSFKYCDVKYDSTGNPSCKDDFKLIIDRRFSPEANISTVFRQMYDFIQSLISGNKVWDDIIKAAIKTADPRASCSGDSCTYYNSVAHECTGFPSTEEVYGKSLSGTETDIRSNIDSNFGSLQQSYSTDSYRVEFTDVTKQGSIGPDCSQRTEVSCCKTCCSKTSCWCCGTRYITSCTFNFYGAAQTRLNVTETAYPKYALYNPVFATPSNVITDHLHLKGTIVAGNTPGSISCSV